MAQHWRRARPRAQLSVIASLACILIAATSFGGQASAEPALWKVQGSGATIYLFGTVHILKPGVTWRSEKIDRAIDSADSLWLEVADPEDQAAMQPLIVKYGLDRAHPLSTLLDPPTLAKFDALLAGLGVTPAQLDPMRPWLAGLTVSVLPLVKAGYDANSGVEHSIRAQVVAAGKPVQGFETVEQQVLYLANEPLPREVEFLKSSVDDAAKGPAAIDNLVSAWVAGNDVAIGKQMNDDMRSRYPDVYQTLIVDRNARFAAKIAELAKGHGIVFVAVGAAHLAGPDSVQADLAKLGLTAMRQ